MSQLERTRFFDGMKANRHPPSSSDASSEVGSSSRLPLTRLCNTPSLLNGKERQSPCCCLHFWITGILRNCKNQSPALIPAFSGEQLHHCFERPDPSYPDLLIQLSPGRFLSKPYRLPSLAIYTTHTLSCHFHGRLLPSRALQSVHLGSCEDSQWSMT